MPLPEAYYPIFSGACLLGSILITAGLGDTLVELLQKLGFLQPIRKDGPASHQTKSQTPTAGGLVFLAPLLFATGISSLVQGAGWENFRLNIFYLSVILLAGLIGFADDYLKKVRRQNEGLKPRQKLAAQFFLTLLVCLFLARSHTSVFGVFDFDLGWFFPGLVFLVLAGALNAANLTDGLDGLASGVLAVAYLGLAILIFLVDGYQALSSLFVALGLAGACLGFLRHNAHPARIFMGDTGSFLLGAGLAVLALKHRLEWYLLFVMAMPILETLSVILQVSCAKFSRHFLGRDWRPFRMTPLHHHFELGGWSEQKVLFVFSGLQVLSLFLLVCLLRSNVLRLPI